MRGKPVCGKKPQHWTRITPADAGKTPKALQGCASTGDHPRGCGENYAAVTRGIGDEGSPPRMRGKRCILRQQKVNNGITPADAGKTPRRGSYRLFVRDHPRGCGENRLRAPSPHGKMGSPPQVRGKLSRSFGVKTVCRITPRRCGENKTYIHLQAGSKGSPPQVRGKRRLICTKFDELRITPAGAGKTLLRRHCRHHIQDHPRRCGENYR